MSWSTLTPWGSCGGRLGYGQALETSQLRPLSPTAGGQPVPGSRAPGWRRARQTHTGLSIPAVPGGPHSQAGQVRTMPPTPKGRELDRRPLCTQVTPSTHQEPCLLHPVPQPQPWKGELPQYLPQSPPAPPAHPSPSFRPALHVPQCKPLDSNSQRLCLLATASRPL